MLFLAYSGLFLCLLGLALSFFFTEFGPKIYWLLFAAMPLLGYLLYQIIRSPKSFLKQRQLSNTNSLVAILIPVKDIQLRHIEAIHLSVNRYGPPKLKITHRSSTKTVVKTYPLRGLGNNIFLDEKDESKVEKLYNELKKLGEFRGFEVTRSTDTGVPLAQSYK